MAVTRINNNQISDASAGNVYVGINASTKVQPYSITATKLANNLTYGSDLTVTGNLTVQGNTTAIDTTYTTIEDPILLLASNQTGAPAVDIGFIGERGTSDNIAFVWDESAGEFVTVYTATGETNTTVSIASYANLHTGNANIGGNITINGTTTLVGNVAGNLSVTGNIASGNLLTTGLISTTSNVNGAGATFTGNVTAQNFIGNISGNIDAGGANTQVQFNDNDILNGTAGFTFNKTSNAAIITGNVTGGNLLTGGLINATGNIISAANINGANLNITNGVRAATGYFTGNVDVLGNLNASIGIVYANSGIFYGNAVNGNSAIFAGIPGYTPLGSNVVAQFAGNANSYSQLNFQNINTGTSASTDFIATADNGSDTTYYVDVGINSSTFNDPANYPGFGPNDSYVHNHGGNLILNPESSGKAINFMIGGTDVTDIAGYVDSTGLSITGIVSASGNVTGANLNTAGKVVATGNVQSSANVTGANLVASAAVIATGNVTGGNLNTGGLVSATGNITSSANIAGGNLIITSAIHTATLNTTGNAVIAGNLFVLGNITYNNVEDLRIQDPVIIMGTGPNGAPLTSPDSYDRGIFMEYYTSGLGNAWMGWQNSSGNMIAAANVSFSGNDIVAVNSYGTFQAGNIYAQSAVTTGNISGSNLNTGGQVIATGNITGGNLNTGGQVIATGNVYTPRVINGGTGMYMDAGFPGYIQFFNGTGVKVTFGDDGNINAIANITGANLLTGGVVTATGNITGGNLITTGLVSATGNVNAAGATFSGNVTAQNFIGNISGNIDAGGANTQVQFNDNDILNGSAGFTFNKTSNAVSVTGNITGGNLISNGNIFATSAANVQFNDNTWFYSGYTTLNTSGIFHDTGANPDTIQVSTNSRANGIAMYTDGVANSHIISTGGIDFITGGTLNANTTPSGGTSTVQITSTGITTGANITATGNVTGANVIGTTSVTGGNIVISGDNITDTNGRVNFNTAGGDVDFAVNGDTVANVFYVDAGTGTISIGSATQTTNAILAMNATNSFLMPVGNTAQRPGTGVTGMLRFNSTTNGVEVYNASEWATVGTPSFTIISDQQFNGDGSTVAFNLSSATTTNSTIVSINGILQIPTIAYSVGGGGSDTLTFTEAPLTGDIIDVRVLTTTTEVVAISNSPGNAVVAVNPTSAIVQITGDLNPTANVTYDLGSPTARWNELYLAGNTIALGTIVIKDVGSNQIGFFQADGTTPATIDSDNVDTTTIANGTSSLSVIASGGNIRANVGGATIINITSNGIENGQANGTGNIGSATTYFNTVHAKATSAQYADLAEVYAADAGYKPGTVVSFGGEAEVTVSTITGDARIAGVVSTNPSYVMNATLESEHTAIVALTGRVPTLVSGPVAKGDMMVSGGNGRAIACATPSMGTVIGKALEYHPGGDGVIEVVVGRL
jgi:hypothetical protein